MFRIAVLSKNLVYYYHQPAAESVLESKLPCNSYNSLIKARLHYVEFMARHGHIYGTTGIRTNFICSGTV